MEKGAESRVREIVEKYFLRIAPEVRSSIPPLFSRPGISFFSFQTNLYYILSLVNQDDKKRIENLTNKSYHPFPGLIKPDNVVSGVAFDLTRARNVLIERCAVKNMFTLSLGKDCTIIVSEHTQSINTNELGPYEYTISLAYIVSFGDEINIDNFHNYLEDVISYSFKQWRKSP